MIAIEDMSLNSLTCKDKDVFNPETLKLKSVDVVFCDINCRLYLCFQHLKQQQDGLSHLISVIKDDLEDIKLIEHGLSDSGHIRGGILS